jgi:hypothetical protein
MDMIKSKLLSGSQFVSIVIKMLSEEKTEQNLVFCLAYLSLYIDKYIHLDHYEETSAKVFDTLLEIF